MLVKELIECLSQMSPNAIVDVKVYTKIVDPISGVGTACGNVYSVTSNGPIVTLLGEER